MHLARSGRVIVQLTKLVEEGQVLCDEKSGKVAKVMELIGPVAKPYASVNFTLAQSYIQSYFDCLERFATNFSEILLRIFVFEDPFGKTT